VNVPSHTAAKTVAVIRRLLLALFLIGGLGTGTELLLLGHTEGPWQWSPVALISVSFGVLVWYGFDRRRAPLRVFGLTMVLFVLSGAVGVWLHYRGNAEFEREMYPSLQGIGLFRESMTGATPVLAPGTMLELGLIGLAYTYRHPALTGSDDLES
jgi:hypothetical protein